MQLARASPQDLEFDAARGALGGHAGHLSGARTVDADRPHGDDQRRIGTGKELVARALHDYGKRRTGPFVAVNMAAIPRELIESELFGHEKGAFTGANARSAGRFEQAEGGTLFLDEIGDMPMEAQTRLLRVLQQGEYTTVGGRTAIRTDVRIIAATNKDLRVLIGQGLFREDLFFRLYVVPLRLPPLRERVEDVPDLVRHFLAQAEREGLPIKQLEPAAVERLKRYRWPGNVRELENLARRLAALYPQDTLSAAVIDAELSQPSLTLSVEEPVQDDNLAASVERYLIRYFANFSSELPPPGLYHRILREVEHPLLSAALAATRGNQIRAADLLGVNRNTLRRRDVTSRSKSFGRPPNHPPSLGAGPERTGLKKKRSHCCNPWAMKPRSRAAREPGTLLWFCRAHSCSRARPDRQPGATIGRPRARSPEAGAEARRDRD